MTSDRLDPQAIDLALTALNEGIPSPWVLRDGMLHKEFVFVDFIEAFGFMAQAALVAESMNHHPQWCNVYNRVRIDLSTHDSGGLTAKDFTLARHLERLATGVRGA